MHSRGAHTIGTDRRVGGGRSLRCLQRRRQVHQRLYDFVPAEHPLHRVCCCHHRLQAAQRGRYIRERRIRALLPGAQCLHQRPCLLRGIATGGGKCMPQLGCEASGRRGVVCQRQGGRVDQLHERLDAELDLGCADNGLLVSQMRCRHSRAHNGVVSYAGKHRGRRCGRHSCGHEACVVNDTSHGVLCITSHDGGGHGAGGNEASTCGESSLGTTTVATISDEGLH